MKFRLVVVSLMLSASLSFCAAVFAHHGNATYDTSKPVVLKATVKEFVWANPHSLIMFDAQDGKGGVIHWTVESGSPASLGSEGWNRNSLRVGDQVTIYFFQAKTGAPVGRLGKVVLPDGKELFDSGGGRALLKN